MRRGHIAAVERVAGVPFFALADLRRLGLAVVACLLVSCASTGKVPRPAPTPRPVLPGPTLHAPASMAMSAPEALAWAAVPMGWDLWTTDHAFAAQPGATEINPLGSTPSKRHALALAGTASAAWLFYEVENGSPHWSRRVPRYVWTVAHGLAGVWNLWQARRKP